MSGNNFTELVFNETNELLNYNETSVIANLTKVNQTTQTQVNDIFRFVTEGILLTIVSTFGLVGNSMSIFVLTSASGVVRQGGASFSKLLRGLASFDALFLFTAIISFGFPQLSHWYARNVFLYMMPIVFGLLHTFRVGSVYVTLAVTFERFHAIICPLKHFIWKKYLLPASVVVAVVYNIPKFFEMELQYDPVANKTVVRSSAMRRNPLYMSLYVFWSKFIFIEIIPYVTIMVMNVFIIIKISKSAKFRRQFQRHEDVDVEDPGESDDRSLVLEVDQSRQGQCNVLAKLTSTDGRRHCSVEIRSFRATSRESRRLRPRNSQPRRTFIKKQQEEHTLGLILIGMSSLFIFCQSFKIIPDMYELIVCSNSGNLGHTCAISKVPVMNVITRMSHLLVCFNSSTNFLIYYLNGEKFRKAWIETYGGWCCFCRQQDSIGNTTTVVLQTTRTEVPVETTYNLVSASSGSSGHAGSTNQTPIQSNHQPHVRHHGREDCNDGVELTTINLKEISSQLSSFPSGTTVSEL